ncbi:permease [Patescibacteria group bacterium]|nr:permease [Patescibacteria group bacterium]
MKRLWMKTSGSIKLLILVVIIYVVFGIYNPELIIESLTTFLTLLKNVLPVLVLVFFLMFIFNFTLSTKQIVKILGHESGVKGYLAAMILGIISAGPIYMWYPLLSDLQEKGAKNSLLAVFLYNRAVKLPLIPMMIFYFGLNLTISLTIFMIIFSVLNGLLMEKILLTKKI